MDVRGVSWLGLRTDSFEEMSVFFKRVLGVAPVFEARDFIIFGLPNGDKVELFGPDGPYPPGFFDKSPVVPGMIVADIGRARRELEEAGVQLLGPTMHAFPPYLEALGSNYAWQHLRAPDGKVLELCARLD
jgi:hypothetical protein